MGAIKEVAYKDESKRSKIGNFAAIKYDGSYRCAAQVISMIGIDNLDFPRSVILNGGITDALIDSMMDNNSNLKIPEVIGSEDRKIHSSRSRKLNVDSWIVTEIDDAGYTEFIIVPDEEFKAHFVVF